MQEELEQARWDLVGAFSGLLDECNAAWGAYRIAADRMRSAYVLALLEEPETASAFAGWLERRLVTDGMGERLAPLVTMLWSSSGATAGSLHRFSIDGTGQAAPAGDLANALERCFEAHRVSQQKLAGLSDADVAGLLQEQRAALALIRRAEERGWHVLPEDAEEELASYLDRTLEAVLIWTADGSVEFDRKPGPSSMTSSAWLAGAVTAHEEVGMLAGLTIRHITAGPALPRELLVVVAGLAAAEPYGTGGRHRNVRHSLGPAVVAAWDSLADQFDEATPEGEEPEPPRGEAGETNRYQDIDAEFGRQEEALAVLRGVQWFEELLDVGSDVPPRLLESLQTLLIVSLADGSGASEAEVLTVELEEAQLALDRWRRTLETAHLGDSDVGLRAKIARVRLLNGGRDLPGVTDYVERVLTGLQLAAEDGVKLATLLRGSGRSNVVGPGDVLRVVAIGAWLDAVGGWVVREPALASVQDRPLELFQDGERTASEQSLSELLAAADVAEPSVDDEWFRAAVEHIGMRWDGVGVMGEGDPLDLDADWSDAVDADGLARR